jgi:hypothetical protein
MDIRIRIAALLGGVVLVACNMKARLQAEASQIGATLDVKVNVNPDASGTLTFKGLPAFEKLGPQKVEAGQTLALTVPISGMPAGKNSVAMHFEGKGHGLAKTVKGDGTLTFDRTPATPELRLSPSASKAGTPTLPCSGALCMATSLPFGADGKLYVDVTNCDGCTVEAGSQTFTVKGDPFPAAIDMTSAIANVQVAGLNGISDVKIPFKVTQGSDSGEQAMEGKAPALLAPILRRVAQGALPFAGETATAPKSAIIVRKDQGLFFRVVGSPSTMRDVQLLGVATMTVKALGSCGIYESSTSKQKITVGHSGETYDITMFDRRTGKALGHRTFPFEDKGCADTLVAKTVTSVPNDAQIVAWATTFLK